MGRQCWRLMARGEQKLAAALGQDTESKEHTLQLMARPDRTSFSRARVEIQECLESNVVVTIGATSSPGKMRRPAP